jgi:lysophospholipase L1-like esterase
MTDGSSHRVGWRLFLVVGAFAFVMAGCSSSSSSSVPSVKYYVSLGDSYAVGYQPLPAPHASPGYTAYVATAEHLQLENFGCAGATSASILSTNGCAGHVAATDAVAYLTTPQATSAEAFIRAHKGSIALITVSIGGNDVTKCATVASPITCFYSSVSTAAANITTLAKGLRSAAGSGVPIIGLTYPDVLLGLWVHPAASPDKTFASLSVTGFQDDLNPALKAAYTGAGAKFVDITAATGAYTPLTETTTLSPFGVIPVAVAQVCTLTWYCAAGSIHANTQGYTFIGRQIVAEYSKLPHS